MSVTMDKKMILQGVPTAWVFLMTTGTGSADNSLTPLWFFDNLNDGTAKKLLSGSSSSGSEYIEFGRNDNAKIKFPKESLDISGINEAIMPSSNTDTEASSDAEMTIVTNEAPIQCDSMTDFYAEIISNKENKLLIVMPTGYSYNRMGVGTSKKPDGFAYMFGKITSDLEIKNAGAQPLTLTFSSQYASYDEAAVDFTGQGILVKKGGAAYDIPATVNIPVNLEIADMAALNDGLLVIKENPSA